MTTLRIFTDIHLQHENRAPKNPRHGDPKLMRNRIINDLKSVVEDTARNANIDLIAVLGDDIRTTLDPAIDAALYEEFASIWAPIRDRSARMPGNHDRACFEAGELSQKFGFLAGTKSYSFPEATVIFWCADTQRHMRGKQIYYEASQQDLKDLERELALAPKNKRVLLLSHIPVRCPMLSLPLTIGNIMATGRMQYSNRDAILRVLRASGHRITCIAGHRHIDQARDLRAPISFEYQTRFVSPPDKNGILYGPNYMDIVLNTDGIFIQRMGIKSVHAYR